MPQARLLENKNLGVVTSVMSLLMGLASKSPAEYEELLPLVIHLLTRLVSFGGETRSTGSFSAIEAAALGLGAPQQREVLVPCVYGVCAVGTYRVRVRIRSSSLRVGFSNGPPIYSLGREKSRLSLW